MKANRRFTVVVVALAISLIAAVHVSHAAIMGPLVPQESTVPGECRNELQLFGASPQLEECLARHQHQSEPVEQEAVPDVKADVEEYWAISGIKAFAVAKDPSGLQAWGWATGETELAEAMVGALVKCEEQADRVGVEARCQLIAVGNEVLGPEWYEQAAVPDPVVPEGVVYGTRWIEGTEFQVGVSGETQVWVSPEPNEHRLVVYLVNGTDRAVTFAPENIRVKAFRNSAQGVKETAVQTFSAEQWEKKVETRQAWSAALSRAGAALANTPQTQTSTFYGRYSSYGSGSSRGSYYGTITSWPSAKDYAEANARTQAQVQTMSAQLERSFEAMASTLMRTHTFTSDSFYGGVVVYKKQKADRFLVTVPFAGVDFEFEFQR